MTKETASAAENTLKTALAAAAAIDFKQALKTDDGRAFALVPDGFALKDISDPALLPFHAEASVEVDERQALIDYVNRFREAGTVLFADVDKGEIGAVIDYHLASGGLDVAPGTRAHFATLKLRESEEFARWNAFQRGGLKPQAEFAQFLEENAVDIVDPDAATMLEIARDLSATEGMIFQSKVDLTTGNRTFHYQNETKVTSDLVIPKSFTLAIPIYAGEAPRALECLFRYRISAGGLVCGFEWRRVQYLRLAHFKEIAFAVAEGTGAPVFMGREK